MTYESDYREQMDKFYPELWKQLDLLPTLEPQLARRVLEFLLDHCSCQNINNLNIAYHNIPAIPREWLLEHIEDAAEFLYEYNDEWEYRRLGEIYMDIDSAVLRRHIERGLKMDNPDIQDAAQSMLEWLSKYKGGV